MERATIRQIREAVTSGRLTQPFSPKDVNRALGIHWAGNFLPKHREGKPGNKFTVLFVQESHRPALYSLKN